MYNTNTDNKVQSFTILKALFSLLFLINVFVLNAQNDILVNHYMFNELSYNPAVCGKTSLFKTDLLVRQQWLGFEEAPSSQVFNIQGYAKNVGGLGLSCTNDKLGFEHTINLKLLYAQHFQLSRDMLLSFGGGIGFVNKGIDASKLNYEDDDDNDIFLNNENHFKPDFNFGTEFSVKGLTFGASASHIHKSLSKADNFSMHRHIYIYSKYIHEVNKKFYIQPSLLLKSSTFITQYDMSALFFYDNKLWAGFSYRLKEAYVGIFGFSVNNNFQFSYSYDYTIGTSIMYNNNSHEIMLTYQINSSKNRKMMHPRYF